MRKSVRLVSVLLGIALFVAACSQEKRAAEEPAPNGEVVAVHVTAGGIITMNGREVSIDQVRQEFSRLASVRGTVRYSRDNPAADPHPNAMEVIKAAAAANLSILMPDL